MKIAPDPERVEHLKEIAANVKNVLFWLIGRERLANSPPRRVKETGTLFEKTGVIKVDKIEKD